MVIFENSLRCSKLYKIGCHKRKAYIDWAWIYVYRRKCKPVSCSIETQCWQIRRKCLIFKTLRAKRATWKIVPDLPHFVGSVPIKGGKFIKDLKWDNLGWFSNTLLSIFLVNVRRRIPMDSRSTELLPTMPGVEQGKVFQKLLIALLLTSNHSVLKSLKKSHFTTLRAKRPHIILLERTLFFRARFFERTLSSHPLQWCVKWDVFYDF